MSFTDFCSRDIWGSSISKINCILWLLVTWSRFNIMSYQYRKSLCGDETIFRSSYLHNGISYTSKTTSIYWIRTLRYTMDFMLAWCSHRQCTSLPPLSLHRLIFLDPVTKKQSSWWQIFRSQKNKKKYFVFCNEFCNAFHIPCAVCRPPNLKYLLNIQFAFQIQ